MITYTTETFTLEDLIDQIPNFTTTPDGGVDWKIFAETKEEAYSVVREDGIEWEGVKPVFADAIKKLDGKTVKMTGYMFPLDQTEEQTQFLFGPFPLSCPYHYHVSNNMTVEAHAKKPIEFSYEPVTVEGVLELVPLDYEYNTFYRLRDVKVVK